MKYQFELINLGRNKINEKFELEGNNNKEISILLYARIKKYLISDEIQISEENTDGKHNIFAGFHKVGEVKIEEIK
jgi:hypothetical protein